MTAGLACLGFEDGGRHQRRAARGRERAGRVLHGLLS